MGVFKRTFASLGLVALLAVSGTALADENDDIATVSDETVSDVVVSGETADDTVTDTTADDAGDAEGDADTDGEGDVSKGDEDTQECKEFYSSDETILELSISGDKPFTYTHGESAGNPDRKYSSWETDEINKHIAMLKKFEKEGVTYLDLNKDDDEIGFEDFLKEFGKDFDLSDIHGEQTVTLVHHHGDVSVQIKDGKCVRTGGNVSDSYTFTVYFPVVSNPVYKMPMFFDGKELTGSHLPLRYGPDPNFDRLQALNGKEMRINEFLTVMNEMGALTEDFPKVGEAYGKHTVTFADYEDTWSVVTVVYPNKPGTGGGSGNDNGQPQKPQNPTPPQQSNPPSNNSQNGGSQGGNSGNVTVVTASDMSYRQFRGNDVNLTPIAPAPVEPTPVATESPKPGATPTDNPTTSKPKLPKTGPDGKTGAALVTDVSWSALLALAVCLGFGVIAAVAVIGVRRYLKSDN